MPNSFLKKKNLSFGSGFVKISASCSFVSMNFTSQSPLFTWSLMKWWWISNVLNSWVLNLIFGKIYGTYVVTHQRNLANLQSKICKLLFKLENLWTTASNSNVFSLCSRESHTSLLLTMPWDETWTKKVASTTCAFSV